MRKINFNIKHTWTWPPSNKERRLAEKQKLAVAVGKLPDEILVDMLSFLNIRELIHQNGVSMVCKRWRNQMFKNLECTIRMRTVEILNIKELKEKLCVMKFILWHIEPEKVLLTKAFMEDTAFLKVWEDCLNIKNERKIDKGKRISRIVSDKLFAKGLGRFLSPEREGKKIQHSRVDSSDLQGVLKLVQCVRLHLNVCPYSDVIDSMTKGWEEEDFINAAVILAFNRIFCPEIEWFLKQIRSEKNHLYQHLFDFYIDNGSFDDAEDCIKQMNNIADDSDDSDHTDDLYFKLAFKCIHAGDLKKAKQFGEKMNASKWLVEYYIHKAKKKKHCSIS